MRAPELTKEAVERIRIYNIAHDCSCVSDCHEHVECLLTTLDAAWRERDVLKGLYDGVTDGALELAQQRDRLTAQVQALEEERNTLARENKLLTNEMVELKAHISRLQPPPYLSDPNDWRIVEGSAEDSPGQE